MPHISDSNEIQKVKKMGASKSRVFVWLTERLEGAGKLFLQAVNGSVWMDLSIGCRICAAR